MWNGLGFVKYQRFLTKIASILLVQKTEPTANGELKHVDSQIQQTCQLTKLGKQTLFGAIMHHSMFTHLIV